MKKGGYLKSKSKTSKTSTSNPKRKDQSSHQSFRTFQSNLLSLISHELKTPLMGIMNSLRIFEEQEKSGETLVPKDQLLHIASKNARNLEKNLNDLLDLASMEAGVYFVKLKEIDFKRLVEGRVKNFISLFHEKNLSWSFSESSMMASSMLVLADPKKISRAIEVCFHAAFSKALEKSKIQILVGTHEFSLEFSMDSKFLEKLKKDWSDSLLETKNQTGLSHFALSGTLSSEKDFLSRIEEGLGAEFVILHEIMRRHGGKFSLKIAETHEDGETPTTCAKFSLKLPELKSMDAVKKILDSRSVLAGHEIETFALCMAKAKEKCSTEELLQEIQKSLFRSTDSAYEIPEKNAIALFIDDCKSEDIPKILKRIQKNCRFDLETSFVVYPDDGMDGDVLLSRVLGKAVE